MHPDTAQSPDAVHVCTWEAARLPEAAPSLIAQLAATHKRAVVALRPAFFREYARYVRGAGCQHPALRTLIPFPPSHTLPLTQNRTHGSGARLGTLVSDWHIGLQRSDGSASVLALTRPRTHFPSHRTEHTEAAPPSRAPCLVPLPLIGPFGSRGAARVYSSQSQRTPRTFPVIPFFILVGRWAHPRQKGRSTFLGGGKHHWGVAQDTLDVASPPARHKAETRALWRNGLEPGLRNNLPPQLGGKLRRSRRSCKGCNRSVFAFPYPRRR